MDRYNIAKFICKSVRFYIIFILFTLIHDTTPTKCTILFLRYLYYNTTLIIPTCFSLQGTIIMESHHLTFKPRHLSTKLTNLVLIHITLVWFPNDGPLWTETCGNVKCDFVIHISKEQLCAFCCEHGFYINLENSCLPHLFYHNTMEA
jgi:hypothetical protein